MSGATKLAMFVVALTLAHSTLSALGFYAVIGVGVDTGLKDEVNESSDDLREPTVFGQGADSGVGPSFFGIAIVAGRVLANLFGVLLGDVYRILTRWGAPGVIAASVQVIVDYAWGLTLLRILRGFDWIR